MSNKFYHGTTHTFTDTSGRNTITLKAGKGEKLNIENLQIKFPIQDTQTIYGLQTASALKVQEVIPYRTTPTSGFTFLQGSSVSLNQNTTDLPNLSPYLLSVAYAQAYGETSNQTTAPLYPSVGGDPYTCLTYIHNRANVNSLLTINSTINASLVTPTDPSKAELQPSGTLYSNTMALNWAESAISFTQNYTTFIYRQDNVGTWTMTQKIAGNPTKRSHIHKNYLINYGNITGGGQLYYRANTTSNFNLIQTWGTNLRDTVFWTDNYVVTIENNDIKVRNLSPAGSSVELSIPSIGFALVSVSKSQNLIFGQVLGAQSVNVHDFFTGTFYYAFFFPENVVDMDAKDDILCVLTTTKVWVIEAVSRSFYTLLAEINLVGESITCNSETVIVGSRTADGNLGKMTVYDFKNKSTSISYQSLNSIRSEPIGLILNATSVIIEETTPVDVYGNGALVVNGGTSTDHLVTKQIRGEGNASITMSSGSFSLLNATTATSTNLVVTNSVNASTATLRALSITTGSLSCSNSALIGTGCTIGGNLQVNGIINWYPSRAYGRLQGNNNSNGGATYGSFSEVAVSGAIYNEQQVRQGGITGVSSSFTVPRNGFYCVGAQFSFTASVWLRIRRTSPTGPIVCQTNSVIASTTDIAYYSAGESFRVMVVNQGGSAVFLSQYENSVFYILEM